MSISHGHGYEIKVKISDGIALTGSCYGELIISLIKVLLLLKRQIPVSCDALTQLQLSSSSSLSATLYGNTITTAISNIHAIFKNILLEFKSDDLPLEVLIIFGSSTIFAKEIYRIVVPEGLQSHYDNNHTAERHKRVSQILRDIMFSELQEVLHVPLPLTNTFIVIKKRNLEDDISVDHHQLFSDFFLPLDSFQLPQNVKQIIVGIEYKSDKANCCSNLKIFGEEANNKKISDKVINGFEDLSIDDNKQSDDFCFLQSKIVFKGFKDPNSKIL